MTEPVISLKSLSKNYKIYNKPSDRMKEVLSPRRRKYHRAFPALNNINMDIYPGETVGVVGRNGCGKSTLLQIICGIMPPCSGEVIVRGKISAILELGSGFNPEFTGVENVFLKCSIMGMSRTETEKKLDKILEFADIGEFAYRQVKTYSSGMAVRLGFAVAISVDPDILVVDEALSVGDVAFQRKCFARIEQIREQGATILFVSHSPGTVVDLCDRAILLNGGELLLSGEPKEVMVLYHKLLFAPADRIETIRKEIVAGVDGMESKEQSGSQPVAPQSELDIKKDMVVDEAWFLPDFKPQSTVYYECRGAEISEPAIETIAGKQVNQLISGNEYIFSYKVRFLQDAWQVRYGMLLKGVRGYEFGGYAGAPGGQKSMDYVEAGEQVEVKMRFCCLFNKGEYFLNCGVTGLVDGEEIYLHRMVDAAMFKVVEVSSNAVTAEIDFGISLSCKKVCA